MNELRKLRISADFFANSSHIISRCPGEKSGVFKSIEKWKNAMAYAAERLVLQETFLKLKIRGL